MIHKETPDLEFTEAHKSTPTARLEEKLDTLILHLERIDKRDKLRMWGGFVRGMLGLIPLALLLGSAWYFLNHGEELIKKSIEESARQATKFTQSGSAAMLERFFPNR